MSSKKLKIKNYLMPYVIEDTGRGERSMDIYSRLLQDRIVFLGTEIDDGVANAVVAQMLFLKMDDPAKAVQLYINSPGGSVSAGLAIYDTMQWLGCEVRTYCVGQAASIAALLLASGTRGQRYSLPNCRLLIHQPLAGVTGPLADIAVQTKEILRTKHRLAELLAQHTSKPVERIIQDSERDFYMTPAEGREYGLIDEVIRPLPAAEAKTA
jgi:ATP-dependent Clp protease, protease subunit